QRPLGTAVAGVHEEGAVCDQLEVVAGPAQHQFAARGLPPVDDDRPLAGVRHQQVVCSTFTTESVVQSTVAVSSPLPPSTRSRSPSSAVSMSLPPRPLSVSGPPPP